MNEPTDGVVILTLFRSTDVAEMCKADADAELRKRFAFPPDFKPSLGHSANVLARWDAERVAGTRFPFAVRSAVTGELLGGCELRPTRASVANVSYWTYPPHRGGGVATRAVRLICELAHGELAIETLEAEIDSENVPSRKVAVASGFVEAGERNNRALYVRLRSPVHPRPN